MKNKFIVFEGLDGSGSSTQAQLLVDALNNLGKESILTSEPTSGPIGHLIREFFQGRITFGGEKNEFDKMMSFLFAADRTDHLYNDISGVFKALEKFNVISTRYYYSSLAYHSSSIDEMDKIFEINKDFYKPDYIFYLDINPEDSIERMKYRFVKDKYENLQKLKLVHENYKYIFKKYEPNAIIIDANLSIHDIHKIIINSIVEKI